MDFDHPTILQTPRLILRLFAIDDVDALVTVHGDPEVMRFSISGMKSKEQIVRFIRNSNERHRCDGHSQWAVIWKETGQCIGECGISMQHIGDISERELSYRLNRGFWGRGIATEAARSCLNHAFETLHLDRVISIIDPQNAASIRVAEKIGMKRDKVDVFQAIPVVIFAAAAPARQATPVF